MLASRLGPGAKHLVNQLRLAAKHRTARRTHVDSVGPLLQDQRLLHVGKELWFHTEGTQQRRQHTMSVPLKALGAQHQAGCAAPGARVQTHALTFFRPSSVASGYGPNRFITRLEGDDEPLDDSLLSVAPNSRPDMLPAARWPHYRPDAQRISLVASSPRRHRTRVNEAGPQRGGTRT